MKSEDLKQIKNLLEEEARTTDLKVGGETSVLKTPEQKQAEQTIQSWKKEKHKQTFLKEFRIPKQLLKVLLSTSEYFGMVFYGEGGIGKTVLTITEIKNFLKPNDWEYSNGYTTPLSLYEFLFKNRNKRVIILDDVEGLFNNKLSISILKGALWDSDGKRIVQYSSKSEKATSLPSAFVMNSKIIILCNKIPKQKDFTIRAMITRTITYEISFSFEEKIKICSVFVEQDHSLKEEQIKFVKELLSKNVDIATKDFNFRTLRKLIAFVKYDEGKAEELFKATTEQDELRESFLGVVSKTNVVNAQIELFRELTGMSRRTFFRIKRELKKCVKVPKVLGMAQKQEGEGGKYG